MVADKAPDDGTEAFKLIKESFDGNTKDLKKQVAEAGKALSHVLAFCEDVLQDGQEMLILSLI